MTTERQDRVRKYVQSQAALQAMRKREEDQRNPFEIQEQITKPQSPQEEKGFFSKVLNVLSYPGELGMGLLTSAIKIPGIEQETDREIERGGVGTTQPVIERQRQRRAELLGIAPKNDPWGALQFTIKPTNWKDYARATRQAYVEARDAKEYEMGVPFLGEVFTDPTTYIGIGAVKGAAKAIKGGAKTATGKRLNTAGTTSLDARKVGDLRKDGTRLTKNAVDSTPTAKTSPQIDREVREKNKGILNDFLFNSKFSGYLGNLIDPVFGRTIRYGKLSGVGKTIANVYYRLSDDVRKARVDKNNFNASGKNYNIENMGDAFEDFIDTQGFTPKLKHKSGGFVGERNFNKINRSIVNGAKKLGVKSTDYINYRIAVTKDGRFNTPDFITGFFQDKGKLIGVRELLNLEKVKYIDDLSLEQIQKYTPFKIGNAADEVSEGLARGVLKARATVDELGVTLEQHAGAIGTFLVGADDAMKAFVNNNEVYFPRDIYLLQNQKSQTKNIFDAKLTNAEKLSKGESITTARKGTSTSLNEELEANVRKVHRLDDTIQNVSEQVRRIIREDYVVKDLEKIGEGVTVLSVKEFNALKKIVDRLATDRRKKTGSRINKRDLKGLEGTQLEKLLSQGDNAEDIVNSLGRRISQSKQSPASNLSELQKLLGEGNITNDQLGRVFFRDEKSARQLAKALDIGDASRWRSATRSFETANNVFRTLGTGFDFSWHLLQGLPLLGAAFFNPNLYRVYGSSMKHAALAMLNRGNLQKVVDGMDPKVLRDATENYRINLSQDVTDAFAGTTSIGQAADVIERAARSPNSPFSKIANFIFRTMPERAQAAFQLGGDVARLKGVEVMGPLAASSAKELVRAGRFADEAEALAYTKAKIGSFLTKATGGIDQYAMGLTNSQQSIERAFFFFSPSYQRASLSLISATLKGDIEGQLARRSLAGMAMLGTTIYVAQATALGQEPKLDPSRGDFMSLRIGDSDVGIGGFYRGFLSFISRMSDRAFTDENVFEQDQTHPFVSFARGKVSPTSGLAWDIFEGSNFIGEPIEANALGYGKAVGSRLLPFWAENVFVTDPLTGDYEWTNPNVTGLAAELIGLRNIPLDAYDERRRIRDEEAQSFYGKQWNELNNVQREVLKRESEYLRQLETETKRLQELRGDELQGQLNDYYKESQRILKDFDDTLKEGTSFLDQGIIDLEGFRKGYINSANSDYYTKRTTLRERTEEGDLSQVGAYWTQIAGDKESVRKIDYQDDVLDVAYQDYITNIVTNPEIQTITGETDWYARGIAINEFENRWQEKGIPDVMNYVKARSYASKDLPPLVTELFMARDYYQYYWSETEKAALENVPEVEALLYKEYKLEPNETKKRELRTPSVARIESIIRAARKELRKLDQGLDGFLYRWGYVTVLENGQNAGKETVWKYPAPFTLEQYQGSL